MAKRPITSIKVYDVHCNHVACALEGEEGLGDAESFARRSLALDADCGPASLVLGLVQHLLGEMVEAVRLTKRALELDPNDTETLRYFIVLRGHPRFERLMREIQARWVAFRA